MWGNFTKKRKEWWNYLIWFLPNSVSIWTGPKLSVEFRDMSCLYKKMVYLKLSIYFSGYTTCLPQWSNPGDEVAQVPGIYSPTQEFQKCLRHPKDWLWSASTKHDWLSANAHQTKITQWSCLKVLCLLRACPIIKQNFNSKLKKIQTTLIQFNENLNFSNFK